MDNDSAYLIVIYVTSEPHWITSDDYRADCVSASESTETRTAYGFAGLSLQPTPIAPQDRIMIFRVAVPPAPTFVFGPCATKKISGIDLHTKSLRCRRPL